MSWLFKSFQSDGPDSSDQDSSPSTTPRGVKDDLSVLSQTLGRQFRGVANFLAPPPLSSTTAFDSDPSSQALLGIRNDLVEIGGSFKSGLSILSSTKAVSGISKLASNLLPFQNNEEASREDEDDEDDNDVPGVTDEVLDFAAEISTRPELWTDFPLPLDNDFNMSDAQKEHASTVERLAPSLADLRVKLQDYMSGEQFWIIYFILLLPRLSEYDFELLSTSKIIEARDVLLQKLQKNAQVENENSKTLDRSQDGSKASEPQGENVPSDLKDDSTGIIRAQVEMDNEENTEQWLEEEDIDTGTSVHAQNKLEHEDPVVSFSDLEGDDNDLSNRLSCLNIEQQKEGQSNVCNDWVQLNGSSESQCDRGQQKEGQSNIRDKDSSEGEDSNDWLTVDEFD